MLYSRTGVTLTLDLSKRRSEKKEVPPGLYDAYLGGRGLNTRYFWDQVPPATDPFSAANPLLFATGILTGTQAPGANRTILTTLSPQTQLQTYSSLGGFWGSELKHAGYDNLHIWGRASTPVYLWIRDDNVEIRDARHLWGLDVRETGKRLRQELKQDKIQLLCIGPAGENKVMAASIEHGSGTGASRAGVGAVMGDKRLKAIVVYGSKDLAIARPQKFNALCQKILAKTNAIRDYFERSSTETHDWFLNNWAWGNLGPHRPHPDSARLHAEFVHTYRSRQRGCDNCALGCKVNITLPDGEYCTVKCQSWFAFMFAFKIRDLHFNARCINLCEKFGLDVVSTACNLAFAVDLYEKGILTKADTGGIALKWGQTELAFELIEQIARREGIGDTLADGVFLAARRIGRGASKYAYHIKRLEMIAFQPWTPYRALRTAVTDRLDMTRAENSAVLWAMENPPAWKRQYVKDGFFHYPREYVKPFVQKYSGLTRDYEKMVPFTSRDADTNALADSSGACIFWTGFWLYPPMGVDDQIGLIAHATGMSLDEAKAIEIAQRINLLTRAYNVRQGIRRKDDVKIPSKFFREDPPPPDNRLDPQKFERMISAYYKLRGWNYQGIPKKKELDRLKLQDVSQDFQQRGIL